MSTQHLSVSAAKSSRFSSARCSRAAAVLFAAIVALGSQPAYAANLFWDTNGTVTAGSGAATGTWGSSAFWSTDSTGANVGSPLLTAVTTQADDLVFAAGTNGTTGTVTVSGTKLAHSLTFDDPVTITLSGGTAINLGSSTAGSGVFLAANGNANINTAVILNNAATALSLSNSGTSTLTFSSAGITGSATSGTQTLTSGASGTGGNVFNGVIGDGAGGGNVAFTVNSSGTGTTTLNGVNTYTGATTLTSGKLTIGSAGSLASGSAVTVTSGVSGALTVNGVVGGNVTVNPSSAANTSNLVNNGTITGTLTIKSSTVPAPIAAQGNAVISGNATLNAGSTTGAIVNDGQLTIAGATAVTTGTISSTGTGSGASAGTGAVFITNSGGSNLTFANGSSFARIAPGNGGVVNLTSLGTTSAYSYGQNNVSTTQSQPFTANFNGGTFNFGQAGQNNSGAFTAGTTNILGGTVFNLAQMSTWAGLAASNGGGLLHGTWNIGGASAGTMAITGGFNESGGVTAVPAGTAINGLQINVGNGGTFSTTTASTLGFANAAAQVAGQTTAQTTNSVTVNSGGTATTVGNFTLANTNAAQTASTTFNTLTVNTSGSFSNSGGVLFIGNNNLANTQTETNTVTVAGGTLNQAGGAVSLGNSGLLATNYANVLNVSSGTMNVGTSASAQALQVGTNSNAASNTVTNTVNLSGGKLVVSGQISALAGTNQTNTFNWTGGQLTAGTVTATSATWATAAGGGIASSTLINTAGTFAPGDIGFTGKTTVTGNYTQAAGGTLAIDLGGIVASSAFQDSVLGKFDLLAVTGTANLGGHLSLSLLSGFTPVVNSTYKILTATTSVVGTFSELFSTTVNDGVNIYTFDIGYNAKDVTLTLSSFTSAVPEPSTYAALAGLGILGFAVYRRRGVRSSN